MILSQKNIKSHVENHVNDKYCSIVLKHVWKSTYVLKKINPKLILISPNPS